MPDCSARPHDRSASRAGGPSTRSEAVVVQQHAVAEAVHGGTALAAVVMVPCTFLKSTS